MNKKQSVLPLVFILITSLSFAEEASFDPFPKNKNSTYEYDDNNIPEICFFPADKARWDGSKITAKEWSMLTDFQKTIFISEYINTHYPIIKINGWNYLVYLNKFAEKLEVADTPMTMAIESILFKENKAKNE